MGLRAAIKEYIEIRRHNARIERQWVKDGRPVVATTIGWRLDPWQNEDGQRNNGDGSYSRLLRGGTKEYREKFAKAVKQSSTEWME